MQQIISNIQKDLQVGLLLSCSVGHPVLRFHIAKLPQYIFLKQKYGDSLSNSLDNTISLGLTDKCLKLQRAQHLTRDGYCFKVHFLTFKVFGFVKGFTRSNLRCLPFV